MGSNISVINKTQHSLHLCLKQVTPLYFQNCVAPGESFTRDVGKVWFTIEARVALPEYEYSTSASIKGGLLFGGAAILSVLNPRILSVGAAGAIGAVAASNSGTVVWSPGWYMGYDRRFEIRSKVVEAYAPSTEETEIKEQRVGEGGILMFELVEVCITCNRDMEKSKCLVCER